MTIAWVIGSGGLLGAALCRSLRNKGIDLFTPTERFRWNNEAELSVQLEMTVKAFAVAIGTRKNWQIYWAAGIGTMSSTETELALETRVLLKLLNFVESEQKLIVAKGNFAFASSAGAIYAGTDDDVINENTLIAPTTAYACEKLRQENLIREFALRNCKVTVLLARISTLYGTGQATGKAQGLLSQIARCILRNQPIQIYVPLDTIRDYIAADDAATAIITTLCIITQKSGVFTKIIASEKPTTIAEIISIYKRIARRTPKIVTGTNKLSKLYNRRIQFN